MCNQDKGFTLVTSLYLSPSLGVPVRMNPFSIRLFACVPQ